MDNQHLVKVARS